MEQNISKNFFRILAILEGLYKNVCNISFMCTVWLGHLKKILVSLTKYWKTWLTLGGWKFSSLFDERFVYLVWCEFLFHLKLLTFKNAFCSQVDWRPIIRVSLFTLFRLKVIRRILTLETIKTYVSDTFFIVSLKTQ